MTTVQAARRIEGHGLRPTSQRIAVLQYLDKNRIHPCVEEIYAELVKRYPSFSKTTVYNCLSALVQCGLAMEVKIDAQRVRYDGNPEPHGHFLCKICGGVYDFEVENPRVLSDENFKIEHIDVYLSGRCKNCNDEQN